MLLKFPTLQGVSTRVVNGTYWKPTNIGINII